MGAVGGVLAASRSSRCAVRGAVPERSAALAMSHAVSVRLVKYGGDSTQPMGKGQRESHEWHAARGQRKGNTELRDVSGLKPHPIKTIGDVDFGHVHWAISGVGVNHLTQKPLKSSAKLHGLAGSQT